MPWTTPRTWNVGETVTATVFNQHVRDNLNVVKTNIENYGNAPGGAGAYGKPYPQNLIYRVTGAVSNSGSGETVLKSFTLPALADGEGVDLDVPMSLAANTNVKTLRIDIAGQKGTLFVSSANVASNVGQIFISLSRFSSTVAVVRGLAFFDAAVGAAPTIWQVAISLTIGLGTPRLVSITGQGTASADINAVDMRVHGVLGGTLGA